MNDISCTLKLLICVFENPLLAEIGEKRDNRRKFVIWNV